VLTKVVATIGPATATRDGIHSLAELGVDVVRVNFAHGTHEQHAEVIRWTREASDATGRPIAVLADLAGPKIRIGVLPQPIQLREKETVVLAPETEAAGNEIPTTYPQLAADVKPGDRILLDDGHLELRVDDVRGTRVECRIIRGGELKSQKGMNLPGVNVSVPALTEKDLRDLELAIREDVDYVGLSFVQRADDVKDLRTRIPKRTLIVSKIEKDNALENLEEIIAVTDAVMVARGDLGVELPFEQVPIAQKRIIQLANYFARPVITATQMLESMVNSARPTRAEVSDVANALFDGTDAVMLSGETAVGRYPFLAVEAMVRIATEIEKARRSGAANHAAPRREMPAHRDPRAGGTRTEHAVAGATVEAAKLLECPAIVTLTRTGFTARLVSSYRPPVPIIGVTDQPGTWRQLALMWGVQPVLCTSELSYDSMLACARDYLMRSGIARAGDRVVVTAGVPFHVRGTTNMMRVEAL